MEGPPSIVPTPYRDYPCPECGDKIPLERVAVVQFRSQVSSEIDDPGFQEHVRKGTAHHLIAELLDKQFISFEQMAPREGDHMYPLIATLGVVSPSTVATLEERISTRQAELAQEVAAEAKREIANWGSYYHGESGPIYKSQAIDAVNDALRIVLRRKEATKAA
jgi:hypothetical protein